MKVMVEDKSTRKPLRRFCSIKDSTGPAQFSDCGNWSLASDDFTGAGSIHGEVGCASSDEQNNSDPGG
jgi:hypothetical protein